MGSQTQRWWVLYLKSIWESHFTFTYCKALWPCEKKLVPLTPDSNNFLAVRNLSKMKLSRDIAGNLPNCSKKIQIVEILWRLLLTHLTQMYSPSKLNRPFICLPFDEWKGFGWPAWVAGDYGWKAISSQDPETRKRSLAYVTTRVRVVKQRNHPGFWWKWEVLWNGRLERDHQKTITLAAATVGEHSPSNSGWWESIRGCYANSEIL